MRWYRDREAWRLVLSYLLWLAGLNLLWEIAQLPLYTIWREASAGAIAFAVAHCTAGDLLIGSAALAIALTLTRADSPSEWRWTRIAVFTTVLGVLYTAFSEWTNTTLFRWSYSELMPRLEFGSARLGLSPLLQWLVLPALSLYFARITRRRPSTDH